MEYNDYELVSMAQENNEYAINVLHEKYKSIIYSKSRKAFNLLKKKGLELSDVMQEAMIGFEEAIMAYNQDDNALFYTFASICIDRQLKSLITKHSRDKYKILNEAVALDFDEDDNVGLQNFLTDEVTPETEFFNKEGVNDLYDDITNVLTDLETCVFELKVQGFEYKEISDILDLESKDIYNAIGRIKNKINKVLDK